MSRESNDAFDAYVAREGYKPGTWNHIRSQRAWNAALEYAQSAWCARPEDASPSPKEKRTEVGKEADRG